ncbi:TlpA family protein disulfide reductase [Gemmatimonadota bacterium]
MTKNLSALVRLLGACLSLCVLTVHIASAQDEVGIPRGSEAPAVEIDDLENGVVNLADFLGSKPVVLEFWATWCEQCEALAPSIERAVENHGEEVVFFAIAVGVGQSKRAVRRHVERHSPGYPFLFDSKGAAVRAYQAPTTAYVVIVNAEGKVSYTGVGGDQDVESALREVVAENSPEG